MKDIERLVIYGTREGERKARIFYADGTEREISTDEAIEIMHRTAVKNNMSKETFKKYLQSDKCRFTLGKTIDAKDEEAYLNSFRKETDNVLEAENVNGYDVNVNRAAFPMKGNAKLTEEDLKDMKLMSTREILAAALGIDAKDVCCSKCEWKIKCKTVGCGSYCKSFTPKSERSK